MDNINAVSNLKTCKLLVKKILFDIYKNVKEIENLETVIEIHEKIIEKLEIERINTIKELKDLETTTKKRIRRITNRNNK